MSGEARTDAFMLGTATVMIGPCDQLMNLNTEHSIGLVKNFAAKSTPSFTDLEQGVKSTLVYSVMTGNEVMCDAEMYEYTGKNLSYSLGLDGSAVAESAVSSTVLTAVAAPTPPALTAAVLTLAVGGGTGFTAGDYCFIQVGTADQVFVRKLVSKSTDALTFDSGFPVAIPVGTSVRKVNVIAVGSQEDQPYLAAKIVGTMANGDEVVLLLPKIRVSSGLSLAFKTDKFDFMPLQFKIFDLVTSDPLYTMFQTVGPQGKPAKAMLLTPR